MNPKPKPTPKKKAKRYNGIKITDPDKWFSLCIRERADWTCERCGKKFPEEYTQEGLPKAMGLDCSHYFGRGNWATRFDPLDAEAHCRGCHGYFGSNPHHFTEHMKQRLGQEKYDILVEKSNNRDLGKQARREQAEIAVHYKRQFEWMRTQRDNGRLGRIDFQGYL